MPGLTTPINDMDELTKMLEAEMEAQKLKQRQLLNTMKELQHKKQKLEV